MTDEVAGTKARKVVVGVDGSDPSRLALRWSLDETKLRSVALEIVMAWHYPLVLGGFFPPQINPEDLSEGAGKVVDQMLDGETPDGSSLPITRTVVSGNTAKELINSAKEADLLVLGSRGHGGFAGLLLGSVSLQCAAHAPCPVAIIHERHSTETATGADRSQRIVVGVDGSEGASRALEWAVDEAARRGSALQIVHAWTYPAVAVGAVSYPTDSFSEVAADVVAEAMSQASKLNSLVAVEGTVLQDTTVQALVKTSDRADLLVVGSRGRGGFPGLLLGSVSQQCAHHAHCSVIIAR